MFDLSAKTVTVKFPGGIEIDVAAKAKFIDREKLMDPSFNQKGDESVELAWLEPLPMAGYRFERVVGFPQWEAIKEE